MTIPDWLQAIQNYMKTLQYPSDRGQRRRPSHAENATEARGEEEVRKPKSECCGYVSENEDLGFSPGEGGGEHVNGEV